MIPYRLLLLLGGDDDDALPALQAAFNSACGHLEYSGAAAQFETQLYAVGILTDVGARGTLAKLDCCPGI